MLRGDHQLNPSKAEKLAGIAAPLQFAPEERIASELNCSVGSLGPVDLSIPVIADRDATVLADFVCGANEDDYHFTGVNWERDCPLGTIADVRTVAPGDVLSPPPLSKTTMTAVLSGRRPSLPFRLP